MTPYININISCENCLHYEICESNIKNASNKACYDYIHKSRRIPQVSHRFKCPGKMLRPCGHINTFTDGIHKCSKCGWFLKYYGISTKKMLWYGTGNVPHPLGTFKCTNDRCGCYLDEITCERCGKDYKAKHNQADKYK